MPRIPDEDRNGHHQAFVPPPERLQPPEDPGPFDRVSPAPPPEPGPLTPLPPPSPKRSARAKHGKHAIRGRPGPFGRIAEAFSGRLWLRVAGIALLAVIAGVAGFLLLSSFLGDEDGHPSPEDTVLSLFEAARNGECETAVGLVTEEFWSADGSADALQVCQGFVDSQTPGWVDNYTVQEVLLRSEEAGTATVGVTLNPESGADTPPEWVASLASQDDGTWLVETVEATDLSQLPEDAPGPGDAAGPAGAPGRPESPPTGGGPELDRLAVSCYQGDMGACDQLFDGSFDESQDYGTTSRPHTEYGATCGGRFTGEVLDYCEVLIPDSNG